MERLMEEGAIDLSAQDEETLISAVRYATRVQNNLHIVVGALAAELKKRGTSYRAIAKMVGHPRNTVWRWAKPFLADGGQA